MKTAAEHPIITLVRAKLKPIKGGGHRLDEEALREVMTTIEAMDSVSDRERAANVLYTIATGLEREGRSGEAAVALTDLARRVLALGGRPTSEAERARSVKAASKAQIFSLAATAPHVGDKAPVDTVTLRSIAKPPSRIR